VTLVVALLALGCVERGRERTAEEAREVRRQVSKTAPSPAHLVGANFGGKIELLGYDVEPEKLAAGKAVKIVWHWKSTRRLGEDGWGIFTHLHDGEGAARENLDGEGIVRRLYPPSDWKPGEYIRDEQRFDLPDGWDSEEALFYLGLWRGEDRMGVTSGPHDSQDRVPIRIPTTAQPAALPRLRVPRIEEELEADGALDEPAWRRAARSGAFVNTMTGRRLAFRTEARVLWTTDALWVGFDSGDRDLHSTFQNRDDSLWEQDAVEVFLDPGGDGRDYYELQVSPRNVVFDSLLPRYRRNRNEWNSNMETGVRLDGTLNTDEGDETRDRGWTAEMRIPWSDLTHAPSSPPAVGDVWRANLFRMEWHEGAVSGAAWSPPRRPDFHTLARFGEWEFVSVR